MLHDVGNNRDCDVDHRNNTKRHHYYITTITGRWQYNANNFCEESDFNTENYTVI